MRYFTAGVLSLLSLLTIQYVYSEASFFNANAKVKTVVPKIKFKLVAALIKTDGSIIPVVRTDFTLRQFSWSKIKIETKKKFYAKYKQECTEKCSHSNFYEIYNDKWDSEATNKINEMEKKHPPIKVKTDFSGAATVEVAPGIWYITGQYSFDSSSISNKFLTQKTWDYQVEVKPGLERVELSNDEAINDKDWDL